MDSILVIIGFCCMLIGVIGAFFLWCLEHLWVGWASAPLFYNCDSSKLLDSQHYIIGNHYHFNIRIYYPVQRNKTIRRKFYGIWGTNGLVAGLLSPIPFGFLIGAFTGALMGELLHDDLKITNAWKLPQGLFIGFLASSFMQFLICVLFIY
jgi:uncharacterized protein YqgC (DUF456 family)